MNCSEQAEQTGTNVDREEAATSSDEVRTTVPESGSPVTARWQKLTQKHRVAIVSVHHTRKAPGRDPFETVSGTLALNRNIDTLMVLKRDRSSDEAILHITGREVSERQLQLEFSEGNWEILGDVEDEPMTEAQSQIFDTLKAAHTPLSAKEIGERIGKKRTNVNHRLEALMEAGLVHRPSHGKYAVTQVTESQAIESECDDVITERTSTATEVEQNEGASQ